MATEAGPAIDPIHQFALHPVVSILVGGHDVSLTNSSLFMLLAVGLTCLLKPLDSLSLSLILRSLYCIKYHLTDFKGLANHLSSL